MNKSDYLRNAQLNLALRAIAFTAPASHYVALYTVAPTSSGGGTEVVGASYSRQSITFGAPGSFVCTNSGAVTFTVPTEIWGIVVATAVFDASTAGNMLYFGTLATPKYVDIGNQVLFPGGFFSIGEG